MGVFIVTWNLNKERSNYNSARAEFIKQIEMYDNTYDPDLESVRFISTDSDAYQIDAFLRQKLDSNDRLFVSKLNKSEYQGWLIQEIWEWIRPRL